MAVSTRAKITSALMRARKRCEVRKGKRICSCTFKSNRTKAKKIAEFMRIYGDDVPEAFIQKAVHDETVLDRWATRCDEHNELIGTNYYIDNDWYLCTLKYLAVKPEYQGRGIGKELVDEVMGLTKDNDKCLVLAADITFDNTPSKSIFQRNGFKDVTHFCWGKTKKPADIMHYVRFPSKGADCTDNDWSEMYG